MCQQILVPVCEDICLYSIHTVLLLSPSLILYVCNKMVDAISAWISSVVLGFGMFIQNEDRNALCIV